MKQRKIMLPSISAAKEFVKEAGKCDFDIDLTRVLTVEYNGENEEFEELLDELEKNIAVA